MEELLLLAFENNQILTHDGDFNQCDGVAMGSPLGPFLVNIFMSQFDTLLANETARSFYHRYVDDICLGLDHLLAYANTLHSNLNFTYELEDNQSIPFLDLKITRWDDGRLKVAWYKKPTDTNVLLNCYSLLPEQYKKSLIRGNVH